MAIKVQNPVVKPSTEELTFDTLWVSHCQIQAENPQNPVRVLATLLKVASSDSGYVVPPRSLEGARGSLLIPDLYKEVATSAITIPLPATLGGQGPAVTLHVSDVVTAFILALKAIAEEKEVI